VIGQYILRDKQPIPCSDLLEWGRWLETADRRVAADEVGSIRISTVFLGLDHNFGGGPPLLFETMVFGGDLDQECERYSTWEEAEAGHRKMIERVKASEHWPDVIGN
jgi:hypothetical protein